MKKYLAHIFTFVFFMVIFSFVNGEELNRGVFHLGCIWNIPAGFEDYDDSSVAYLFRKIQKNNTIQFILMNTGVPKKGDITSEFTKLTDSKTYGDFRLEKYSIDIPNQDGSIFLKMTRTALISDSGYVVFDNLGMNEVTKVAQNCVQM